MTDWEGGMPASLRLSRSWARHRFVTVSSLSSTANVLSRSGSGKHWRSASRALKENGNECDFDLRKDTLQRYTVDYLRGVGSSE